MAYLGLLIFVKFIQLHRVCSEIIHLYKIRKKNEQKSVGCDKLVLNFDANFQC